MGKLSEIIGVPFASESPRYLAWNGTTVVPTKIGATINSGIVPSLGGILDISTASITTLDDNTTLQLMQYVNGIPVDMQKLYPYKKTPVGAWQNFTPSFTNLTATIVLAQWRRIGDSMQIRVTSSATATSSGIVEFSMPTGYTITGSVKPHVGLLSVDGTIGNQAAGIPANAYRESSTIFRFYVNGGIVGTTDRELSNDLMNINVIVPVNEFAIGQEDYGIKLHATSSTNIRLTIGAKADENTDWSAINATGNWFIKIIKGNSAQGIDGTFESITARDFSAGEESALSSAFSVQSDVQNAPIVLCGKKSSSNLLAIPAGQFVEFSISPAASAVALVLIQTTSSDASGVFHVGNNNFAAIISQTSTEYEITNTPALNKTGVTFSNTGSKVRITNGFATNRNYRIVCIGLAI